MLPTEGSPSLGHDMTDIENDGWHVISMVSAVVLLWNFLCLSYE